MGQSLVVGGTGYVGGELCRQLADLGEDVYILGRSKPPRAVPGKWLAGDITDRRSVEDALEGLEFNVIYHLASLPGDTGDPEQMMATNMSGLLNLLLVARDAGVDRFVLSSSISAYGWYPAAPFEPPDYLPVDEEHPCRPADMYSSTKRMQEILALTFHRQYGLPVAILRLTAVVGPRGSGGGRSWLEFARDLAGGERVEIPHFSLDEVCHYVDVRDAARMHIVAGSDARAVGEIFNCCGPAPTSGSEFAEIIGRLAPGIAVETGYPWSMAQGNRLEFDMSKARRTLGFVPQYTLEDSIRHIIEWIDAGGLDEKLPGMGQTYERGVEQSS